MAQLIKRLPKIMLFFLAVSAVLAAVSAVVVTIFIIFFTSYRLISNRLPAAIADLISIKPLAAISPDRYSDRVVTARRFAESSRASASTGLGASLFPDRL